MIDIIIWIKVAPIMVPIMWPFKYRIDPIDTIMSLKINNNGTLTELSNHLSSVINLTLLYHFKQIIGLYLTDINDFP